MVEDFEKKYGALAIPYPKDSAVADIAAEEDKQVAESQARAATVSAELAKWEAMMPIEEMNLEEAIVAVPHLVPNHSPDKPQFWPFNKDFDEWKAELGALQAEYEEHHSMKP